MSARDDLMASVVGNHSTDGWRNYVTAKIDALVAEAETRALKAEFHKTAEKAHRMGREKGRAEGAAAVKSQMEVTLDLALRRYPGDLSADEKAMVFGHIRHAVALAADGDQTKGGDRD